MAELAASCLLRQVVAFESFPRVPLGETMYDTMRARNEVERRANFRDKSRWYERLVVRPRGALGAFY